MKRFFYDNNGKIEIVICPSDEVARNHFSDSKYIELSESEYTDILPFEQELKLENGKPVPDMGKVLSKKLDDIRVQRDKKLRELDIDFLKTLETDDKIKKKEVVDKKNALRALPDTIKNMNFESALDIKNYIPDIL